MSEVTRILAAIECGDVRAVDELFPLVYQELPACCYAIEQGMA